MYEKQRHVVQDSNNSHVSPDSNYVLSETTLVTTVHTHTFVSIAWFWSLNYVLSQRILVRTFLQQQLSFRLYCLGETWFRPSIKLSCQSYVIDTLSLCTPYVWENTRFCLFLCVLSPRTVVRTFLHHHTSFRLCFLGENQVQTGPSTSAIKHS